MSTEIVRRPNESQIEHHTALIKSGNIKDELLMERIFSSNKDYLEDKGKNKVIIVKVSSIPKPSAYSHKLPVRLGKSEYTCQYRSKANSYNRDRPDEVKPQLLRTEMAKRVITEYTTNYSNDYARKNSVVQPEAAQSTKPKAVYVASQCPTFNVTSYVADYTSTVTAPVQRPRYSSVSQVLTSGQFRDSTAYKQSYREGLSGQAVVKPITQKNNQLFVTINSPISTSYRSSYQKTKSVPKQASCKPTQAYESSRISSRIQTEYNNQYSSKTATKAQTQQYMTLQELKTFVKHKL